MPSGAVYVRKREVDEVVVPAPLDTVKAEKNDDEECQTLCLLIPWSRE